MSIQGLRFIGDRINPGFKSTRELIDAEDLEGLQALAVRQVEAGAWALDVNVGERAFGDPAYLTEIVRALQAAVDVPLCFDVPDVASQEVCLAAYDPSRASGQKPLINSIAETRWEMVELLKIQPCTVILMASERVGEDGRGVANRTGEELHGTAARMIESLLGAGHSLGIDDVIVDVSICALATDSEGLTRMTFDGMRRIHDDPALSGVALTGGLSNLTRHLPPRKLEDGSSLSLALENAFLSLALPIGFDTPLATPWKRYALLPEDHRVLRALDEISRLEGLEAVRRLRALYKDE
jgi:cobalamin-dependent methionine synthase I